MGYIYWVKAQLLILISFSASFLQAQIVNGELEEWEWISMYGQPFENPVGWITNNENDWIGIAHTPVKKFVLQDYAGARIASQGLGIDAVLPGYMMQTIAAGDIKRFAIRMKCDSIFQTGACVLNILAPGNVLLFTDSVKTKDAAFIDRFIDIPLAWNQTYDSITIQLVAKGNLDKWDKEEDGYAVMLADHVFIEFISSTSNPLVSDHFCVRPNPAHDMVFIHQTEREGTTLSIFDGIGGEFYFGKNVTAVDVSDFPPGIFYAVLRSAGGTQTASFIKN